MDKRTKMVACRIAILPVLSLLTLAGVAKGDELDQEWAIEAVRAGEAVPLADILESIESSHGATVFEVDLLKSDDPNVASMYQFKMVSRDGHLIEIFVDTSTGETVGLGGKGIVDSATE